MCSSSISLLQPVAVATVELQLVSIKGGKQRVFHLYRQTRAEPKLVYFWL